MGVRERGGVGSNTANDPPAVVAKWEEVTLLDGSTSRAVTAPEPYLGSNSTQQNSPQPQPQPQQKQKRKGGRKPIYATSEERKQRNRQAQAAFRERRTEYIKQLENTIKDHEQAFQILQQNQRNTADECLMLRYKSSLLERILLEKGVDVQAELRARSVSPHAGPALALPPGLAVQSPVQRTTMTNRHRECRLLAAWPQKVEGMQGSSPPAHLNGAILDSSPHSQPASASHVTSPSTPTTRSPGFISSTSPNVGPTSRQLRTQSTELQYNPAHPPSPASLNTHFVGGMERPSASSASAGAVNSFYQLPFRAHADQLGREFNARDNPDASEYPASMAPYPSTFVPIMQPQTPRQFNAHQTYASPPEPQLLDGHHANHAVPGCLNYALDPDDSMLDTDPFGLSTSMQFPTQFSH